MDGLSGVAALGDGGGGLEGDVELLVAVEDFEDEGFVVCVDLVERVEDVVECISDGYGHVG